MTESGERKAFKDYFDRAAASVLAEQITRVHKAFDCSGFVRSATRNLKKLEFHDRVKQFSRSLAKTLPPDVPQAIDVLTHSLPPALPDCEAVADGWLQWPIGQFIADYGIEHLEESMEAMVQLTQRFTSEFAVRPFVERYPTEVFQRLEELTRHESPHVRRWCSEGVRSRLPWGVKLKSLAEDPHSDTTDP